MKDVTAYYIARKEQELENVREDLEGQVEKLRKTQKSMFYMIGDLNDMSAQLKEARDHLEEKVRLRTDELLAVSRKLQRTERLAFLGKLASGVTHELRNPIAVMKNSIYFLEKRVTAESDPKMVRYMDILKKEIVVIDTIVDDIMGFARARVPQLRRADLREAVENIIPALNIPAGIRVERDFGEVPEIDMDSAQLMHAVTNIANNAIMAMGEKGVLTFRILRRDGNVCVEVEDTGPGIPVDERELVFEPLYTSKPKGTGLGLPIAKMMVESQDGTIEIRSAMPKGTIFRISMPIRSHP
jgi:signal transduction histidine kinase